MASVQELAQQYANRNGVPYWILADIIAVESGWNPASVGDGGTSFGLLQLHWGGQGTGYTQAQLSDPGTNLSIGVPYIAAGYRSALSQGYSGFELLLHTAGQSGHPGGSPGNYIMTSSYESVLRTAYANGPAPTDQGGQGNPDSFSSVDVYLNGKPFAAIAVSGKTYLLYTALNLFGIKYTVDYSNHTFHLSNGAVIQGVVQNGTTYIPYYQIPGIQAMRTSDGHWNFVVIAGAGLAGLVVLGTLGWLGYKYLKKRRVSR